MSEELIITTSPRDDHQLGLSIELGPERTEQALQRAARLVSKKARIPGFRPGKAPYATVLRMFGRDALLGEILDDLGQEVYQEALESQKLDPYGRASLDDVSTTPLTFKLVVPLRPSVALADYQGIRVEAPPVMVGEIDVDAVLEQAQAARATLETVERPAAIGDTVQVDIKGTVGDSTIMDNHDWELTLRGDSGWLPGFDEAFVGLSAGDEKRFELAYPEDSASRYKGQVAAFEVKVSAVKSKVLPALDDEFARSLGEYSDLADYRAKKLEEMRKQREAEAEAKLNDAAVEALVQVATIAYPEQALDDVVDEMVHEMKSRLGNIGYSLEDSLRLQSKTLDGYRQELRPLAEKRLKGRLALRELTTREGLAVTAAEEQAEIDRMVSEGGGDEEGKSIRELFESEAGRSYIQQDLLTRKTLERLRAIATGQAAAAQTTAAQTTAAQTTAAEEAAAAAPTAATQAAAAQTAAAQTSAEPEAGQ